MLQKVKCLTPLCVNIVFADLFVFPNGYCVKCAKERLKTIQDKSEDIF